MDAISDQAERGAAGALVAAAQERTRAAARYVAQRSYPGCARRSGARGRRVGSGGMGGARRLGTRRLAGRAAPGLAPADRDLAWSSPAVLAGSPPRRFYSGRDPSRAATIEDLRAMAHRRLPRFVLEYLEGGAEDEACLARNLEALAEWRFLHRSLVDVSHRDISTVLFDRRMAMPIAIAPTGLNGIMWAHADLRLAQAAAEAGIPFAQSTMSNELMERVAQVPGLRYWWQLYVFGPAGNPREPDRARRTRRVRGADRHDRRADLRQPRMGQAPAIGARRSVLDRPARSSASSALADRAGPDARSAALRERDRIRPEGASRAARERALDPLADGSRPVLGHGRAIRDRWPRKLIIKGLLVGARYRARRRDRRRCGRDLEPWRAPARLGGGADRHPARGAPCGRQPDRADRRWRVPARHRYAEGADARRRRGLRRPRRAVRGGRRRAGQGPSARSTSSARRSSAISACSASPKWPTHRRLLVRIGPRREMQPADAF